VTAFEQRGMADRGAERIRGGYDSQQPFKRRTVGVHRHHRDRHGFAHQPGQHAAGAGLDDQVGAGRGLGHRLDEPDRCGDLPLQQFAQVGARNEASAGHSRDDAVLWRLEVLPIKEFREGTGRGCDQR
jgi:hypothetical protein